MLTKEEFEQKLRLIMNQEERYGVKIDIKHIIDKDHLNCTWYGGEVASIEYKGYRIVIGAYGDIRLKGRVNGEEIEIVDKRNDGRVYEEIGRTVDDTRLEKLLQNEWGHGNYLIFGNNNWFEYDLISPEGDWIDLCESDNVLDDDLLDCLACIEPYLKTVDWYIEQYKTEGSPHA